MSAPRGLRRAELPRWLAVLSRLAGLVFLGFGLAKFVNHGSEVDSFRDYGLPFPGAFVYMIGVIEMVGGALLLAGVGLRIAVPVLAADMVGAIAVSGIGQGEAISFTLAPALLAILVLLWLGATAANDGVRP